MLRGTSTQVLMQFLGKVSFSPSLLWGDSFAGWQNSVIWGREIVSPLSYIIPVRFELTQYLHITSTTLPPQWSNTGPGFQYSVFLCLKKENLHRGPHALKFLFKSHFLQVSDVKKEIPSFLHHLCCHDVLYTHQSYQSVYFLGFLVSSCLISPFSIHEALVTVALTSISPLSPNRWGHAIPNDVFLLLIISSKMPSISLKQTLQS